MMPCLKCGKRRSLWLPRRYRRGSWTIRGGVPVIVDGTITEGDDCCCCITCCSPGTSPPQLELDASAITPNTLFGCGTDCGLFADVFMLDFRSTGVGDTPGNAPTGVCIWRYCGDTLDCAGTPMQYGWDVYIRSSGLFCEAWAVPWLGGTGCNDFNRAPTGSDAWYLASLPTDPDDCCDALSSPLTLSPRGGPSTASIASSDGGGGCDLFNFLSTAVTIQAVGC